MNIQDHIILFYGGPLEAYEALGFKIERLRSAYGLGLCKFHEELKPSMAIYKNSGRYVCFSCGANGDLVKFAGHIWGLDSILEFHQILKKFERRGVSFEN